MKINEAATEYETMRREADGSRALYIRMQGKVEEAGFAAGTRGSDIWVMDKALPPAKPASPDLPLYLAITLFISLWLAVAWVLLMDSLRSSTTAVIIALLAFSLAAATSAQAQIGRAH